MAENKISDDVCEAEFNRFVEAMDLDVDQSHMDDEDRKGLAQAKHTLFRVMRRGTLVFNETGEPVFTPSDGKTITFHEPKGKSLMRTDLKKKGHDVEKLFTFMAAATGESPLRFEEMPNRDLKICQVLAQLFLG